MKRILFYLGVMLGLAAAPAGPIWAAGATATGPAARQSSAANADKPAESPPINIEADRMESLSNDNAIFFSGKVVAKQGGLVIHSDEMTVYYLSDAEKAALPAGDTRKMKKLYATGRVEIQNEGWIATGDAMKYFEMERKVYITGNTKAWQDNNLVTGEAMTLYLDEGKSVVERSTKQGERVRAFFHSGGEGEAGAAPAAKPPSPTPAPATIPPPVVPPPVVPVQKPAPAPPPPAN